MSSNYKAELYIKLMEFGWKNWKNWQKLFSGSRTLEETADMAKEKGCTFFNYPTLGSNYYSWTTMCYTIPEDVASKDV